jgi:predicted permease
MSCAGFWSLEMVHWTGKGYLGLFVPLAVFGTVQTGYFLKNEAWLSLPELAVWFCILVSAVILWVIGSRLNREEDETVSPATTESRTWYLRRINHSFLFVPLEYFGLVMIAIQVFQKVIRSS